MVNCDGLYNKKYYGNKLTENHFSDKKLHFKIIENGTILPHIPPGWNGSGGVFDCEGHFVYGTNYSIYGGGPYRLDEKINYESKTVIYAGMFTPEWGHCITDSLRRLWFLRSDIFKKYFKDCPIVYHLRHGGGGQLIPNFVKLLKILELDSSQWILLKKPTRFQNIILPDESYFSGRNNLSVMFSNEYLETIEVIKSFALKNYLPLSNKNFYIFYGRKSFGEERLANYFYSKGFAIVKPEKLSLEEQLNVFLNCTNFVSTVGSCSHNAVFLKDFSNIHLIPRAIGTALNERQFGINHIPFIKNLGYVDSALSIFLDNLKGPFCYIVSENLRKYFGDKIKEKYTDEDFATFLAYVRHAKEKGLKENPKELEYLRNILPEFMEQLKTKKDLLEKFGITIQ